MNTRQLALLQQLALLAPRGTTWVSKGWKHDYRTLTALESRGLVKGVGVAGVDLRYHVTEAGWTALSSQ